MSQTRRPTGSCTISPDVSVLTCEAALNGFPTASVHYHDRPGAQPAADQIVLAQFNQMTKLARSADGSNFSLRMGDGLSSVGFSGIINGGGGAISSGQQSRSVTAVHSSAKLAGLCLSVYPNLDPGILKTKGTIKQRMQKLTRKIMDEGAELMGKAGDQEGLALHSANTAAVPRWYGVLGASSIDCGALDSIQDEDMSQALNSYIIQTLKAPVSNFLDVIQSLGASFRFHYAPSFSGNGRLIGVEYMTSGGGRFVPVEATGVSFNAATSGALAPGAVAITGLSSGTVQSRGDQEPGRTGSIGMLYPPNGNPPFIHIPAPAWVPTLGFPTREAQAAQSRVFGMTGLDRTDQEFDAQVSAGRRVVAAVRAYARLCWLDISRGISTIQFQTLFDGSIRLGERVKAELNGGVVTGVVASVQHSISGLEQNPHATTTFTLSHLD